MPATPDMPDTPAPLAPQFLTPAPLLARFAARQLARILSDPEARRFFVNFLVYAEEADEKGVFDALVARVDDPELGKLVRRHRDDETRHAEVLSACLARMGGAKQPIPTQLRIVERIDHHAGRHADHHAGRHAGRHAGHHAGGSGSLADDFVCGRESVLSAYLLLQVIEERAVKQYPIIAAALRPYDPQTAAVIDDIVRDEARHVKYAIAVSKRYAADEATRLRLLGRYRRAEARAFAEHTLAVRAHLIESGLVPASRPVRLFWRGLAALTRPPRPANA